MNKKKKSKKQIYIGTSGWSYDWPNFYPDSLSKKDWLTFYSKTFNSAEINYSFYRLPSVSTYKRWFKETSDNFLFALKLSRYISHSKRLNNPKTALKRFIKQAVYLENKCGPILVQLPDNFKINTIRLKKFLQTTNIVDKELNVHNQYAIEFRHASWFNEPEIIELLQQYNAALVFSHSPEFAYPDQEPLTAKFVYLRLHGPGQLYASSYSTRELTKWAEKINFWHHQDKRVYVYFNNDAFGFAPANAETLIRLLNRDC